MTTDLKVEAEPAACRADTAQESGHRWKALSIHLSVIIYQYQYPSLCIYLPTYLTFSIYKSSSVAFYLSSLVSIFPSFELCLPIQLSIYLTNCTPVRRSINQSIDLSIDLPLKLMMINCCCCCFFSEICLGVVFHQARLQH